MARSLFEQMFIKLLDEDITATTAFGLGAQTNQGSAVPGGSDFYAPGDSRVPKVFKTKRKKVAMQRRPLTKL